MSMRRTVRGLLAVALVCGVMIAAPTPSEAASYSISSCTQSGGVPAPPGFDQLTVDVTGVAPAEVELGDVVIIDDVTVTLHNPNAFAIDANSVSITVPAPTGADALANFFQSPFPFPIPAGGSAAFSGVLQYTATGPPGTVLAFRPSQLSFNVSTSGVTCTIPATTDAFASTTVLDIPGYQFECFIPRIGLFVQQTIDIVGTAPSSVAPGASFALSGVVTSSTPPVSLNVLSVTFTLAAPANANPSGPLAVTTAGPGVVQPGVPYSSAPMTFDFVATGPPGSVVEFRPASLTTETAEVGEIICTVVPGQPPIATTIVDPSPLDEVLVAAVKANGEVVYVQHGTLESGDFDFTHNPKGTLVSVEGQGTFEGPTGGASELRVRYERPLTKLRLQDSGSGLDLRATSVLPAITPEPTVAVGVALGRLNRQPVLVLWVIRDLG